MIEKCKTCLSGYPSVECVNCGTGLRNYRSYKPPTNADRIRGMSDEELQKFLHEFESGDIDYAKTFCDLCCKDAALERRSVDCEGCLLWWLKSDAKLPQGIDYWLKAETEGKNGY